MIPVRTAPSSGAYNDFECFLDEQLQFRFFFFLFLYRARARVCGQQKEEKDFFFFEITKSQGDYVIR